MIKLVCAAWMIDSGSSGNSSAKSKTRCCLIPTNFPIASLSFFFSAGTSKMPLPSCGLSFAFIPLIAPMEETNFPGSPGTAVHSSSVDFHIRLLASRNVVLVSSTRVW